MAAVTGAIVQRGTALGTREKKTRSFAHDRPYCFSQGVISFGMSLMRYGSGTLERTRLRTK